MDRKSFIKSVAQATLFSFVPLSFLKGSPADKNDYKFGERTPLRNPLTVYDKVGIRRLILFLEKEIKNLWPKYAGKFNNRYTRKLLVSDINGILNLFEDKKAMFDFSVQCNEQNNTLKVITSNSLRFDIFIQPTKTTDVIELNCAFEGQIIEYEKMIGW